MAGVRRGAPALVALDRRIARCRRCPRLIAHCQAAAADPPRRFAGQSYHAGPVPGYGDREAWLWVIGLAPGAHGANRTGRMFTGDRSGHFLATALHRAGLALLPSSEHADDGQRLSGCYISAAGRCAPPGNRPNAAELLNCRPYLLTERGMLKQLRVILALGQIAHDAACAVLAPESSPPRFRHGQRSDIGGIALIDSFHVSPLNTQTGRLTAGMFDAVLASCRAAASGARNRPEGPRR